MVWRFSKKTKLKLHNFLAIIVLTATTTSFVAEITEAAEKNSLTPEQISQQLGWIQNNSVCGGYYEDPLEMFDPNKLPPLTSTPVEGSSDQSIFQQTGRSVLEGKVSLRQPGRLVHADNAYLNRDPVSHKISSVDLQGNISLREPGKLIVAEKGHMELNARAAEMIHALYRLFLGQQASSGTLIAKQPLNAWGKADEIKQPHTGFIELTKATYSTCAPTATTWHVNAKRIELNHDTGRGTAHEAWLNIGSMPIFYTPYFNFPIDKRRQSGFLFPAIGNSSKSGFNIAVPYYWNIAPNYDAILTPHLFSRRGLQLNSLFRYLTADSHGQIYGSFLPADPAFRRFQNDELDNFAKVATPAELRRLGNQSDTRGYFAWQDTTQFNSHWNGNINYSYVSNDYYFQDFGNLGGFGLVVPNQLLRQANLNYSGNDWTFLSRLRSFQTLHPINQASILNPYSSLPEFDLNGNFPDKAGGFDWQFNNQLVYFQRPNNPGESGSPPSAGRLNIQPGVSWPINGLAGYFTPRLQIQATHYAIGHQVEGYQSEIQRTLPIFDIDSGLYFDRNLTIGTTDYAQTLEPRLFYLYVPYRNQNDIPLFDTALVPFNYDALFLTNRFSGLDRQSDANQLTMALTTRFINQNTGSEIMRASIGQIYYFRDRRLTLCPAGTGIDPVTGKLNNPATASLGSTCTDTNALGNSTSLREKTSPVAGQLRYYFNPHWSSSIDASYDPHENRLINSSVNWQYKPDADRVLNLNYNFLRFGDPLSGQPPESYKNDLSQAGFSFAWPIKESWQAVGGWMYNLSHQHSQTYFYGLEYDSCCWATRLVAGRAFNYLNQRSNPVFNNSVYLQFQFKGLATVGNQDPASFLMGNIPGYKDSFAGFNPV